MTFGTWGLTSAERQRAEEAQEAADWKAGLRFGCCACARKRLTVDAMEQIRPGTSDGTCKPCYKFMWGAGTLVMGGSVPMAERAFPGRSLSLREGQERMRQLNADLTRELGR
jgi:hypothetical protein